MVLAASSGPFLLLDDARPGTVASARFYRGLAGSIRADALSEVAPALEALRAARKRGLHAAGYIAYEAGFALEPRLSGLDPRRREGDPPLIWFGLYENVEHIAPDDVAGLLGDDATEARPERILPAISQADYQAAFDDIQRHIRDGDIYQANFTFRCAVAIKGDPVSCYRNLRANGAAGFGALLFTGDHWLLSFSPEQFFTLREDTLETRPMKGTALRDPDPLRDAELARMLREDPKQRAENLMIVDLLRNDLSKVAVAGSVAVPELFTIEHYPTVHQMTSTVTARLSPGLDAVDALAALFPCGSVTGAPKIKAMEIIHEMEPDARGPYTGAIGAIHADGDAAFSVTIRTISLREGEGIGMIGLGSGLVADSTAQGEWKECLDKARFLNVTDERCRNADD